MNYLNISSNSRPGWRIFAALTLMLSLVSGFTQATKRTAPEGFRPAPLRLPPCDSFDFETVPSACFFIKCDSWIAENQAFAAMGFDLQEQAFNILDGVYPVPCDRLNDLAYNATSHTFPPSAHNLWNVEAFKSNLAGELSVVHGIASGIELSTTSPDFTVQVLTDREVFNEPAWGLNDISQSSPEPFAIPVGTASVELLRGQPAANILPAMVEVSTQRHLGLIHRFDANKTCLDCKASYSS